MGGGGGGIRDLIRSITRNSDDYDEKSMKIKSNLDDKLPQNKRIEILKMKFVKAVCL